MSLLPTHIPEYDENRGATFNSTVAGADGCVYGIPFYSRRFVRLDPKDDSLEEFGPDLVRDLGLDEAQMRYGVLANDGFLYVILHGSQFMLKVDTNEGGNNGSITMLEMTYGVFGQPRPPGSGVEGADGCLYFPFSWHKIMRFDPRTAEVTFPFRSPIGLEGGLHTNDDRIFAVPQPPGSMEDEDSAEDVVYMLDVRASSSGTFRLGSPEMTLKSYQGGTVGRDGTLYFLNRFSQVLALNTSSGSLFVQAAPHHFPETGWGAFGSPCLGSDGCIYWPPMDQDRILKYDPYYEKTDFVGISTPQGHTWFSGATVPGGKTYFFPFHGGATQILAIDPFGDLKADFHRRIESDPLNFGGIFQKEDVQGNTQFDVGVKKFGIYKMLQILDECIKENEEAYRQSGCPTCMLASLCDDCPLDVIYHYMRQTVGDIKYLLEATMVNEVPTPASD
mmetsp:Transcript_4534/g.10717  ORF Transcript_4534/g.10717 Transcript_4534/m.10717 type:complete len:447 (+) Transcript_4534:104-1444(+)